MTFFLDSQPAEQEVQGRVSPLSQIPSWMQSAGANKRAADLEDNANRTRQRSESQMRGNMAVDIALDGLVTLEDFNRYYEEESNGFNHVTPAPTSIEQASGEYGDEFIDFVMRTARERAETDPEAFAGYDLSDEGITAAVNAQMQSSYQDAQDIIAMTPDDYIGEGFAGGMASGLTDMRQAPFLFAGGGSGSILRTMGREAMINVATETALLPSQFDQAERLGIEDPDVLNALKNAAIFGAAFGGAGEAISRGVDYFRGRNAPPSGMGGSEMELMAHIDQVEDAIINGEPIPEFDMTPAPREPIPSEQGLTPPARDPADPGPAPRNEPDTVEEALSREVEAASVGVTRKPVSDYLRDPNQATIRDDGTSITMQVHPQGPAADTLRAMGITSRTRPGLFSKNGRADFDNLSADEMEDIFPGIRQAAGDDGRYLDQEGFLRVLADELNGNPSKLAANERLNAAEASLEEYRRFRDTMNRRIDPIPDDLEITDTQARMGEIKAHVDETIAMSGLDGILTSGQRADIENELAMRGGSVNDLLDAMDDQDLEFAERDLGEPDGREFAPRDESDLQDGDQSGARGSGSDGPIQDGSTEAGSTGSQDAVGSPDRQAFSDPGAATDLQRSIASDINDEIVAGGDFDIEIDLPDERRALRTAKEVMEYLDEGERFSARINLCGLGPS